MATPEGLEVTVEIVCTHLPGEDWEGHQPLHLGIQQDKQMIEAASAGSKRVVFKPSLRARPNADGSTNFLGPFAHGPKTERFVYLVWAIAPGKVPVRMVGRIKLHLNHIKWAAVEKAATRKKPLRVTIALTSAKGKPVFASVRPDVAKWELA
ncbi:MAG TPA: DUF5990 family protein [Steroidobacteraceae bacterium]|jgi:hypothetical protein